jgi:hypothetical protein
MPASTHETATDTIPMRRSIRRRPTVTTGGGSARESASSFSLGAFLRRTS